MICKNWVFACTDNPIRTATRTYDHWHIIKVDKLSEDVHCFCSTHFTKQTHCPPHRVSVGGKSSILFILDQIQQGRN